MAAVALLLTVLALAGFVGAWGVAAFEGVRAEAETSAVSAPRAVLLAFWPFAARRASGSLHAQRAGKAQIALIALVMVAVAAASAYTNLTRPRPAVSVPSETGAGAPNQS